MNKLKKLINDPCAYVFIKLHLLCTFLNISFCSLYNRILLFLKGVKTKGNIICNGIPYFFRVPSSEIHIGRDCRINSSFKSNNIGMMTRSRITTNRCGARVIIGDNVGMSAVTISAFNEIIIGDNTMIGGNVLITDSDWHPISPDMRDCYEEAKTSPVNIGKNVFIGTRSIILKGVSIGDNTVIGAGSVVACDIPENVIACGNPCRVIKSLY